MLVSLSMEPNIYSANKVRTFLGKDVLARPYNFKERFETWLG